MPTRPTTAPVVLIALAVPVVAGVLAAASPAAAAAPALRISATSSYPGGVVTVSGAGCAPARGLPVAAAAGFDVGSSVYGVENGATPSAAGAWTLTLTLKASTPYGRYDIDASCARYDGSGFDYAPSTIVVAVKPVVTATPSAGSTTTAPVTTPSGTATTPTRTPGGSTPTALPLTGSKTTDLTVLGFALVIAGGCTVWYGRRRTAG